MSASFHLVSLCLKFITTGGLKGTGSLNSNDNLILNSDTLKTGQKLSSETIENLKNNKKKLMSSRESNGNLFRNVGNNKHNSSQTMIILIVEILHLSMMSFEEKIDYFDDYNRTMFKNTIITKILPLIQSINCQIYLKKLNVDVIKEFEKSKINDTFDVDEENKRHINSLEYSDEHIDKVNEFLKSKNIKELPKFNMDQVKESLLTLVHLTLDQGKEDDNFGDGDYWD